MISVRGVARAAAVAAMVLMASGAVQADITIDTVTVGNLGNAADTTGYGRVDYAYNIGKYEVTAGQYTAFLNAVAKTDTYGLYNTGMSRTDYGSGITQGGSYGSYVYSVASTFANRPVNYVSWGDAARFANWLTNDQPTGAQGLTTTEDGAYYLNGATSNTQLLAVSRKSGATWAITSENEWYKAAYYNPATGTYFEYPTSSDTAPGQDMADPLPGNNANYHRTGASSYPIDSGKYTTVAGEFQNSDSPYGTFDQGGNVWEWNEAIRWSYRGMRGGAFNSGYRDSLSAQCQYLYCIDPTCRDGELGFRVSWSNEIVEPIPEPVSLVSGAMGLACVGAYLRRRRRTR